MVAGFAPICYIITGYYVNIVGMKLKKQNGIYYTTHVFSLDINVVMHGRYQIYF